MPYFVTGIPGLLFGISLLILNDNRDTEIVDDSEKEDSADIDDGCKHPLTTSLAEDTDVKESKVYKLNDK